jgi:hypothetical protein
MHPARGASIVASTSAIMSRFISSLLQHCQSLLSLVVMVTVLPDPCPVPRPESLTKNISLLFAKGRRIVRAFRSIK